MRFRLSETAQTQRAQLGVPYWLLEQLLDARLKAAACLFSTRQLRALPLPQQASVTRWLGLYVCSDAAGTITHIALMKHRLACAAQESCYPDVATGRAMAAPLRSRTLQERVVN